MLCYNDWDAATKTQAAIGGLMGDTLYHPFGTGFRLTDPNGIEHLIHVGADSIDEFGIKVNMLIEGLLEQDWKVREVKPAVTSTPGVQNASGGAGLEGRQPWQELTTTEGNTFKVEMTGSGKKIGKLLCKIDRMDFTQWGVTIWDDKFAEIGIDINDESFKVGEVYSLPSTVHSAVVLYDPTGGKEGRGTPKKVKSFNMGDIPF